MPRCERSTVSVAGTGRRAFTAILVLLAGCGQSAPPKAPAPTPAAAAPAPPAAEAATPSEGEQRARLLSRAQAELGVLPKQPDASPELVALGRQLFFETRLSSDGKVGCVTCHQPSLWGTDGLPKSKGTFGRDNPRNAPTVFNAALQKGAHWRADRESVEDQARKALLGKGSFGLESDQQAEKRLRELPGYTEAFRKAFPEQSAPITVANWGTAIGAYERTLLTPAPLDAYLSGDANALSAEARAGLQTFLEVGCARCHGGALLGGVSLQRFGVKAPYAPLTGSDPADLGRFDVTKDEADRFVFKVPTLRNAEKTGPYFHDGSVASLPRAVEIMAEAQLGQSLTTEQVSDLVAFLGALTGPVPESFAPPK